MVVCNFDMQFTFACAGWEGSAHDARVFLSVLRDPQSNFPKPPNGNFFIYIVQIIIVYYIISIHI